MGRFWIAPFCGAAMVIAASAGGCGFRPLHAPSAVVGEEADVPPAAREQLAATVVAPIANRAGQILRNELVFLLGAAGEAPAARYSLDVGLTETLDKIAVQVTGLATRANLRLSAQYTLTDLAAGKVVTRGRVGAMGSFDLLDNEFATLVAERNTREQAALRLARILHTRLAAFYGARQVVAGGGAAQGATTRGPTN
jgi:LPS-assembly lipoprotein